MVILSNFTAVPAANAAPQNTRFLVNLLTVILEKICIKGEIAAQELPGLDPQPAQSRNLSAG